eukprot:5800651-Prymnesium_polylepis.1
MPNASKRVLAIAHRASATDYGLRTRVHALFADAVSCPRTSDSVSADGGAPAPRSNASLQGCCFRASTTPSQ